MTKQPAKPLNNRLTALIITITTLIILVSTAPDIGLTWDEPAYITASESYMGWYDVLFANPKMAVSPVIIDSFWEKNSEHPPMDKIWSGLIWDLSKSWLDDLTAHRLGNMLLVAALTGLLYLLLAENYSPLAGAAAVGLLISMPRFFFHAHLAALDVPAAVAIFALVYLFWRTKDQPGWKNTLALGIVFGIAMATKINAVFVLPTLFIWALIFQRERHLLVRLVLAGVLALPVFVLVWPWLYPAPAERLWEYIRWITVDHWEIGQYYLHQFHMPPPWHFPFVMLIAVLPLTALIAFILGIGRSFNQKEKRPLGVLLLFNALVPLLALAIGQSMVYDNDRLFMPAFVFVAALGGIGVDWVIRFVKNWLKDKGQARLGVLATVLLLALVFLPHLVSAAPLYPHWLSYYSGTVGGLPGATKLGLESTYWCETYTEALDYININAEPRDVVWVDPWSHDVMVYYQVHGQLRDDVLIAAPAMVLSEVTPKANLITRDFKSADFIVLQYRQTSTIEGGASYETITWLADRQPDLQYSFKGIPLLEVYQRVP